LPILPLFARGIFLTVKLGGGKRVFDSAFSENDLLDGACSANFEHARKIGDFCSSSPRAKKCRGEEVA
jgi:hypothetical protein